MKTLIDKVLSIRITVKTIALVVAGILLGIFLSSQLSDGGGKASAPVQIASTTTAPATTTTTSTTSTTTTTTTTTAPPKPAHTSLWTKVDSYYDGDMSEYTSKDITEAGDMACRMWNSVAGVSRVAVIREIMGTGIEDAGLAAAISQAVLWTVCKQTATFPNGPLPFDDWR